MTYNQNCHSSKLTIFHQNADRLSNKLDIMNDLLTNINPDVIIITEHGLSKTNLENTHLEGYTLIESFCRENHKKGGVAIWVKDEIKTCAVGLEGNRQSQEIVCEVSTIKLTIGKHAIYIIGIYRPNTNFEAAIDIISQTLETIPTWNSPTVIMGDININCLEINRQNITLQETLKSYNITRLHLPPTRVTPHSATSIDMVCSNQIPSEPVVDILNTFISDHTGQIATLQNLKTQTHDQITFSRHLSFKNLSLLNNLLKQEAWYEVLNSRSAEESYDKFLNTLTYYMDVACPYTRSRKRLKKTQTLKNDQETIEKRNRYLAAQEEYILTGTDENKTIATEMKKIYDLHLKTQRRLMTSEFINKSDNKSKAIWNVINKERCKNNNTNEKIQIKSNGTLISAPMNVATHFNEFFSNIANETLAQAVYDGNPAAPHYRQQVNDSLVLWLTSQKEVEKTITTMKTKSSAGFDNISTRLLKICCEPLLIPLTTVINNSFTEGIFPSKLKLAKVYPKLKKGDPTQVSNYRPISLLPSISKIIEKIVLSRLLDFFKKNNLFPDNQHGFVKGKSTSTALVKIVEYLIKALDRGDTTTAIFLDFTKAFDCLSHDKLLKKLENRGITGKTADWFRSYLTGRTQAVEIKSTDQGVTTTTTSRPLPVNRGVPQGSVLGPILYIIFVSDFPDYVRSYCSMLMYADDTALLLQNKQPTTLEIDSYIAINMAIEYCQANDLVLNQTKTQQIIMGRKKEEVLELPGAERVYNVKYLGVIIDESLSWNDHIDKLCRKLSTVLYVLRRLKQVSNIEVVKCAYYALFESHLRYTITVWGNSSKANSQRVLMLQKKAIRILTGKGPQESCRDAFKQLRILTSMALYISEVVFYASQQHLSRGIDIHTLNTRAACDYILPNHRLSLFEKQPTYAGAQFLNILPQEIKNSTGEQQFRRQLINWLLDRPFYTLEEFLNWRTDDLTISHEPL